MMLLGSHYGSLLLMDKIDYLTNFVITAVIDPLSPPPDVNVCRTLRRRPRTRAITPACCLTGFDLFGNELLE